MCWRCGPGHVANISSRRRDATTAHSVGCVISRDDVDTAAARIDGLVRRTPVLSTELPGVGSVVLKLEQLQHAGSFKSRGMLNRVRAAVERGEITAAGVVTASGGNAGLAAAYAAARESVPATVVVPETAPAVKVDRLRRLGATVQQVGDRYSVAFQAAVAEAERTGAVFCHAYDQPEMCAGNGTLGLELLEQTSGAIDTLLVAVGGGGLIAGIATALEGHARAVAVEPEACPTLARAIAAGQPVDAPVAGVAADALGATRVGDIAWAVATRLGIESVLVDDDAIVRARKLLWDEWRIVVEHGAAVGIAALLSGAYKPASGERVAVVLCGGNTSPADLVESPR
jgi:threonine dehydratase